MDILDKNDSKKINEEALEMLVKFYLNKPTKIPAELATPNLSTPLNDMKDELQRETVFSNLRDMLAQRQNASENMLARRFPEIYDWERIYKVCASWAADEYKLSYNNIIKFHAFVI